MRQFELRRTYRGKYITALALQLEDGLHVSLFGGDRAHIGAVGIVEPDGACSLKEFPGHREGILCRAWTEALSAGGFRPAVVEAGIHYDNLGKDGIREVVSLTEDMLRELLTTLSARPG